jgi:hypothetical protein
VIQVQVQVQVRGSTGPLAPKLRPRVSPATDVARRSQNSPRTKGQRRPAM